VSVDYDDQLAMSIIWDALDFGPIAVRVLCLNRRRNVANLPHDCPGGKNIRLPASAHPTAIQEHIEIKGRVSERSQFG
jgi:hypothetical protein